MTLLSLIFIIFAYLLGSISSAILICQLFRLPDPRKYGSLNPGATNVLRTGNKFAAGLVLFFDMLKGALPVWVAWYLNLTPFSLGLIAIAACLGHIYPIFFQFQGGKGVATAFGALLTIGLDLGASIVLSWGLSLAVTGYSSMAAIFTALFAPIYTLIFKAQYTLPVAMLSCLIIWRHYDNIMRLLQGKEDKIWHKKKKR
ncbi:MULTISPECIES: glycerol-3-phosphate 1-O-acyltransferase PlsY [unclassified Moritella]|uniref:glycerol-3-phosphate 1-O-acyltransferase PlsY n=1 Tax=unclassified Moritella TaxID=2637987 RepID=UPI001BA51949|nr:MULTISPECIES: glycerol-3-phosphate 1-O-acyltransferase PlsY [unclassified Moritella]QUM82324.1 glycerol-3-phosphate 1-O-acyltransferase PlsY [Moritella sp. 5]QUM86622.1 glycerol-3-phosphate 1-O-acyltransferase PlsY [Moritella sp. 28]QUM90850.1 glycerol-3-phosphate 1-O-acyltransferase PlsY [Moritella sp. 36]